MLYVMKLIFGNQSADSVRDLHHVHKHLKTFDKHTFQNITFSDIFRNYM